MSSIRNDDGGKRTGRLGSAEIGLWWAALVGHAAGAAIFICVTGLLFHIPAGQLLLLYTALLPCGLVIAPLLHWVRLSRCHPKTCALRFAIAMFLYLEAIAIALGFGAIKAGILTRAVAVKEYSLPMTLFFLVVAPALYWIALKLFEASQAR